MTLSRTLMHAKSDPKTLLDVHQQVHTQGGWVGQKKAILGLEPKWYIIMTILDIYNRYTTWYNMRLQKPQPITSCSFNSNSSALLHLPRLNNSDK